MAKFIYHNAKNASISYTLFKLNYDYYSYVFFNEIINPYFWSKLADKL